MDATQIITGAVLSACSFGLTVMWVMKDPVPRGVFAAISWVIMAVLTWNMSSDKGASEDLAQDVMRSSPVSRMIDENVTGADEFKSEIGETMSIIGSQGAGDPPPSR